MAIGYKKLSEQTPDIGGELLMIKTFRGSIYQARYDYLENVFCLENSKKIRVTLEAEKVEYWSFAK